MRTRRKGGCEKAVVRVGIALDTSRWTQFESCSEFESETTVPFAGRDFDQETLGYAVGLEIARLASLIVRDLGDRGRMFLDSFLRGTADGLDNDCDCCSEDAE